MVDSDQLITRPAPISVGRVQTIDALRGCAILMVIVHHVGLKYSADLLDPVSRFFVEIGWAGVDIFFAISGFLITGILLRYSSTGQLKEFFIRRFFRIVPLYFVAIAVFVGLSIAARHEVEMLHRIWISASFLTAFAIPFLGDNGVPYTILWSVSVEEFAYVSFAILAAIGILREKKTLVVLVVAVFVLRLALVLGDVFETRLLYYFAPARIDAIAFGGITAMTAISARRSVGSFWSWTILLLLVLAGCATLTRSAGLVAVAGYSLLGICAGNLVRVTAAREVPTALQAIVVNPLARLGLVSYFVYLFHGFVVEAVFRFVPGDVVHRLGALGFWASVLAVTAATFVSALFSWRWFEQPLIALGHRLSKRQTGLDTKCA